MKHFASPEGNLIFSTAILTENAISKLQKKFEDKQISPENYVQKRQKLIGMAQSFLKAIEKENSMIAKKSEHKRVGHGNIV